MYFCPLVKNSWSIILFTLQGLCSGSFVSSHQICNTEDMLEYLIDFLFHFIEWSYCYEVFSFWSGSLRSEQNTSFSTYCLTPRWDFSKKRNSAWTLHEALAITNKYLSEERGHSAHRSSLGSEIRGTPGVFCRVGCCEIDSLGLAQSRVMCMGLFFYF